MCAADRAVGGIMERRAGVALASGLALKQYMASARAHKQMGRQRVCPMREPAAQGSCFSRHTWWQ
eukprot:1151184-Alexandrium_andersonii.AAC.1